MLHEGLVILGVFIYRLINACIIRTYFDPDEYWQCIEVAHKHVFGYGYETWDWQTRIRSWLFVLPFIGVFKLIKLVGLTDSDTAIVYAPRAVQAVIATIFDIATWKFSKKVLGKSYTSHIVLFFSLISLFNFAYLTRTISNSLEAALTACALCFWPVVAEKQFDYKKLALSLALVGLSCLIKPSSAIHWIYPGAYLLFYGKSSERIKIMLTTIGVALATIALGVGIDTLFYESNTYVLTWWNFFRENYTNNVAVVYGSMPWHFYLSQGLPFMMGIMMPLVLVGISMVGAWWPIGFLFFSTFFLSCLTHKEFRFLYQAMPVILSLAGLGAHVMNESNENGKKRRNTLLAVLLITNIGAGIYLTRYHQAGRVQAIDWLRTETDSKTSALFLMPCHSTPFYGYLHRNISMRFLTCSFPVDPLKHTLNISPGYIDEADKFYADPPKFLREHPDLLKHATHIFFFEALTVQWPELARTFEGYGFVTSAKFFNGHWNPDERRSGEVVAMIKQ